MCASYRLHSDPLHVSPRYESVMSLSTTKSFLFFYHFMTEFFPRVALVSGFLKKYPNVLGTIPRLPQQSTMCCFTCHGARRRSIAWQQHTVVELRHHNHRPLPFTAQSRGCTQIRFTSTGSEKQILQRCWASRPTVSSTVQAVQRCSTFQRRCAHNTTLRRCHAQDLVVDPCACDVLWSRDGDEGYACRSAVRVSKLEWPTRRERSSRTPFPIRCPLPRGGSTLRRAKRRKATSWWSRETRAACVRS